MGTPCSKLHDRLYIGTVETARSAKALDSLGVTHVISCVDVPAASFSHVDYLLIPAKDSPDTNLRKCFVSSIEFILDALIEQSSVILVHCVDGVSRSATIILAYLMATQNMSCEEALTALKRIRPVVKPNPGFMQQLLEFEREDLQEVRKWIAKRGDAHFAFPALSSSLPEIADSTEMDMSVVAASDAMPNEIQLLHEQAQQRFSTPSSTYGQAHLLQGPTVASQSSFSDSSSSSAAATMPQSQPTMGVEAFGMSATTWQYAQMYQQQHQLDHPNQHQHDAHAAAAYYSNYNPYLVYQQQYQYQYQPHFPSGVYGSVDSAWMTGQTQHSASSSSSSQLQQQSQPPPAQFDVQMS